MSASCVPGSSTSRDTGKMIESGITGAMTQFSLRVKCFLMDYDDYDCWYDEFTRRIETLHRIQGAPRIEEGMRCLIFLQSLGPAFGDWVESTTTCYNDGGMGDASYLYESPKLSYEQLAKLGELEYKSMVEIGLRISEEDQFYVGIPVQESERRVKRKRSDIALRPYRKRLLGPLTATCSLDRCRGEHGKL